MRTLLFAAAAAVIGLVVSQSSTSQGPTPPQDPTPQGSRTDVGTHRVLPRGCEPHAPLHIRDVRVDATGGIARFDVEVESSLPAHEVEVSILVPDGALAIGPTRVALGSLDAERSNSAALRLQLSGLTDIVVLLQVEGWIHRSEQPDRPERVASTRWVELGDPVPAPAGTPVTTIGDPLARLARSLDSAADRIEPAIAPSTQRGEQRR